ncbi:MAG: BatA domain-containing protein [Elusimicrobia bacterium]|nr:BatA domain-containing protein [Elusimicrobiota bacterium]
MDFLNPAALWLTPLAAAPLVLHLLSLRRARKLPFSDLSLLRRAHAKSLPAARLRQWLILAARCLALAALCLAFARPVVRGSASGEGPDAGMDLVVLLDTSWSMGARERGRTRFEAAQAAAAALTRLAGTAGRVAAAGASLGLDGPLVFARSPEEAAAALGRLKVGPRGTDLAAAAAEACRFLSADPRPRRRVVAVLSDNAASGMRGFAGRPGACAPETLLLGLAWDAPPLNAALLDAEPVVPSAGGEGPRLSVRAALYGAGRRRVALDLVAGGRRAARRAAELSAGSAASYALALPTDAGPELWGRVELTSDTLEADDAWNFAMRLDPAPRALLVAGSPKSLEAGGGGYALRTLLAEGGRLPYRLDTADSGRVGRLDLSPYKVVILDDLRALSPDSAERLLRFVREGGGLWVIAPSAAGLAGLERALPAVLGAEEPAAAAAGVRPVAAPSDGPQRFSWDEFELGRVALTRRLAAVPRPGAAVWFRDAAGAPLLVAADEGRGRVLLWAAGLSVDRTNLSLKPVFAAWVDAGVRWLARYDGRPRWRALKVGEPLERVWDPSERAPSRVSLRGPGGRRTALLVKDRRVVFEDTREPGHYVLEWDGGPEDGARPVAEAWAVNLDRSGAESDLTPAAVPPWKALRPGSLREDFDAAVHGREARSGLLAAALLLLLVELVLSSPPRSGPAPAPRRKEAVA